MPNLLRAFGRTPHPDFALLRLDEFLTKPIVKEELYRRVATQVGVRKREATLDRVRSRLDSLQG